VSPKWRAPVQNLGNILCEEEIKNGSNLEYNVTLAKNMKF
jgi:hypothetical protein